MSPLTILFLSVFATASVFGFGVFYGNINNNNQGGSGHGDSDQGVSGHGDSEQGGSGHGDNDQGVSGQGGSGQGVAKWSYLNTKRQKCFVPTPVSPAGLAWFFGNASNMELSVPFSNYHYKFSFAEIFLSRPVHSLRELNRMKIQLEYDLQPENYYIMTYAGFSKEVHINCTLAPVNGSSGSCVPVPGGNSPGTKVTLLDPNSGWAVYQNPTYGIVAAILCLGPMESGTASWGIYSLYDDEIVPAVLYDIYDIITGQYGLSWI